jgi:hypothetical protein
MAFLITGGLNPKLLYFQSRYKSSPFWFEQEWLHFIIPKASEDGGQKGTGQVITR